MKPGSIYTFRLKNGLRGACRVVREPTETESQRAGHTLVCATRWYGGPADDPLRARETRAFPRFDNGPGLYWVKGGAPKAFKLAGVVPTSAADKARTCHNSAPWGLFPNLVYNQWRHEHEPDALARDTRKANEEGDRELANDVAAAAKRERVDLDGFVPLATPRAKRAPADVLRGFFAAMNQWEKECARLEKKLGPSVVTRLNKPALVAIFREFCTPKDRKYGRLGSYASPPEYDPKRERIVGEKKVSTSRLEIDTVRSDRAFGEQRLCYVMLKTKGAWLIDSAKCDGSSHVL